ncbi:Parkin coregulated protein like protein [Tritrichomonas foetus]|uniref:Parkin coregulated protein like protein n=1 Tax=Tritrichomonas foetus TaxID=1144522 RepID=A0A1J4JAB8_9EUKA|nr:Parkin coregulated protein like protein [Tritrichomonas foetus]|eukprot:OHS95175.1 Parkin coregulated protein like protein [Tritrichomonas foetus]
MSNARLPRFPVTRPPKPMAHEDPNAITRSPVVAKRPKKQRAKVAPKNAHTEFRRFYDRGDIPVRLVHTTFKNAIAWSVDPAVLDYQHYLPLFFDGLREKEEPYKFFARKGTWELLKHGGTRVLQVIPQVVIPLKKALDTRDLEILPVALRTIQKLVKSSDLAGEALIPFYRQLLPVLNEFLLSNKNIGDQIEYGQRKKTNIGDLILDTLEILELNGGPDAFINIQYIVPTYQSAKMPGDDE